MSPCNCLHREQPKIYTAPRKLGRRLRPHSVIYVYICFTESCLIFCSVFEMAPSSMERDGDMEGAAAHCLWQEGEGGGRVGGV